MMVFRKKYVGGCHCLEISAMHGLIRMSPDTPQ